LPGLGTYTPGIELDSAINIVYRADMELKTSLNAPNAYKWEIQYRENIGKTSADLFALWNTEHPDDPVA